MHNIFDVKNVLVLFLLILSSSSSLMAKVERIMPLKVRRDYIAKLEHYLQYEDKRIEASIDEVVNPFFFEQPLILARFSDVEKVSALGEVLQRDVSGAIVSGGRSYLQMKSGSLLREGETVVRVVPSLGNMRVEAVISGIAQDRFTLRMNDSVVDVIVEK